MAGLFGLFNYSKEGPGVAKNGPKKRAFVVFLEIYARKFWKLSMAGLLWVITSLPLVTCGLADAGLTYITRNFSREKHAFIREDFFETIKKNWRIALPVGIINLLVTGVLFYNILFYLVGLVPALMPAADGTVADPMTLTTWDKVILVVTGMVYFTFTWMKYYIPFLMITFKLTLKQVYKNAFLFATANLPMNLLISVILLAVYGVLGGAVLTFAASEFNYFVFAIVLTLAVTVVPGFRSFLIQFCIFPSIKKLMIDPYYAENPNADKQLRRNLNLEVDETAEPAAPAAPSTESTPAADEPVFVDTVTAAETDTPKKKMPRQYNEQELRRFQRQVQSRQGADDDDDTI